MAEKTSSPFCWLKNSLPGRSSAPLDRLLKKERLKYWLALSRVKGLERFVLKGLLERFGSPEEIFREKKAALEAFSSAFADAVGGFDSWAWVEKEIGLIERHGIEAAVFDGPGYPPILKEIYDPPCLLYMKGRPYDYSRPAVAVVGTRRPSHYGLKMAETISTELAAAGVVIVSGMARGCDTAAHKGALASKGTTAAVLGTGIDIAYPRENRPVYDEIGEKGLLISEYPVSTPPVPQNFPRRNRIISGLSRGVLVVEAPLRSGSLMTARLALGYNREVLAVPGQATSPKSAGANRLIKDGAVLVECAKDVLDAFSIGYAAHWEGAKETGPVPEGDERLVFRALGSDPLHIDSITEITGLSAVKTSTLLLEMELKGMITQCPGKCFIRRR